MKKYFITVFLLFVIIVAFTLGVILDSTFINDIDKTVFDFLHPLRNTFFDYVFVIISYMGETYTIVLLCALFIILPCRKYVGIPLTITTAVTALINTIMKMTIQRPRPEMNVEYFAQLPFNYEFPTSFSFPSGHSQSSVVFYVVLVILLTKYFFRHKHISNTIIFASYLLALNLGIARIYLGVHYPSDVITGLSLATIIILLELLYVNYIPTRRVVHVIIDKPKGTSDLDFKSITYPVDCGYVDNYYRQKDGTPLRCYILHNNNEENEIYGRIVAHVKRLNDIEDRYVVVPYNIKIRKKDIIEKIRFIEDYYEFKVKMI